jgi:hypothetical protein
MHKLKVIAGAALIAILFAGCSSLASRADKHDGARHLSDDQKHRLYSAALAASDSPMDNDTFKDACRKIGIFDTSGQPNDQYMAFVAAHLEWAMKPETREFKQEISTTENARAYLNKYLPQ